MEQSCEGSGLCREETSVASSWNSPTTQVLSGQLPNLCPAVSAKSHRHWALSLHCHSHTMLSGHRREDLPQNVGSWLCSLPPTSLMPAPLCFNKRSHKSGVSPPHLSQPSTFSHLISSLNQLEQTRTPGVTGIYLKCQSRRWDRELPQVDLLCISPSLLQAQGSTRG